MKETIKFPDGFLWGAATSSHQVEGNNRNNDWWKWEAEGRTKKPSGKACNQYELFKSDFKLAKSLNHNAHRFSLEWSRIQPEEGKFDRDALAHYKEVIKTLRSLNITPVITLNHFTLPLWFAEKGGWIWERSVPLFSLFAEKVAKELGEDVEYWITINEPVGYINAAYVTGNMPPGRRSFKKAGGAIVNILKAHCLAYKAIHKVYKEKGWPTPKVSVAKFTVAYTPCRQNSKLDILSTRLRHYYVNMFFLEALMKGRCLTPGIPFAHLPLKEREIL
jgi:beta-glucosidase